jgi:hypothetical protein
MGVEIWPLEAARDAVRWRRTMGQTARRSVRWDRAGDRTSGGPPEGFGPGPNHAPEHLFGPPLEWSGPPPDGPAWPDQGPNWTASGREFHRLLLSIKPHHL